MIDLKTLTIVSARKLLDNKDISVQELSAAHLKLIEERNPEINAYLEIFDDVKDQAALAQEKVDHGKISPLTGIPLAFKDNILVNGKKVSAASKILQGYRATYDATVTKKLREEGVVILGRTNMDEFAMGSSTENSAYGVTKNPHDESRVPGGTSGGSAAAVASHMAIAALGSDTGGSIRQPSSFCGVVGLKPTYGSVSRYGLIADVSSFDQVGPISKTVGDAEILFTTIQGHDIHDSTSLSGNLSKKNSRKSIGVPRDFIGEGVDAKVLENFERSLVVFKEHGYQIMDISLPYLKHSLATYYIIMFAEASTNLARFDGVRYGLHKEGPNLLEDYMSTRGEGFGREENPLC